MDVSRGPESRSPGTFERFLSQSQASQNGLSLSQLSRFAVRDSLGQEVGGDSFSNFLTQSRDEDPGPRCQALIETQNPFKFKVPGRPRPERSKEISPGSYPKPGTVVPELKFHGIPVPLAVSVENRKKSVDNGRTIR